MADWNERKKVCGNCQWWPLGGFQHKPEYHLPPSGNGGNNMDGTVSDCRAYSPTSDDQRRYPGATALWPQTRRDDWCGEFKPRNRS